MLEKITRKIEETIKKLPWLYMSVWHGKFVRKKITHIGNTVYVASGINYGGGMAHQLACWREGYFLCKINGFRFANSPLWINGKHAEEDDSKIVKRLGFIKKKVTSSIWDELLGIDKVQTRVSDLLNEGYKVVRLPLLELNSEKGMNQLKTIIGSYQGTKTILRLAVDQTYKTESVEYADLYRELYYEAEARQKYDVEYSRNVLNIGVHIRRGDVSKDTFSYRFLDLPYYVTAINEIIDKYKRNGIRNYRVYVFSEGHEDDFNELKTIPNLTLCLDWSAKKTFVHMVEADVLVTGISGFSVIAALIGHGDRYCTFNSITSYPKEREWNFLDDSGHIISPTT